MYSHTLGTPLSANLQRPSPKGLAHGLLELSSVLCEKLCSLHLQVSQTGVWSVSASGLLCMLSLLCEFGGSFTGGGWHQGQAIHLC